MVIRGTSDSQMEKQFEADMEEHERRYRAAQELATFQQQQQPDSQTGARDYEIDAKNMHLKIKCIAKVMTLLRLNRMLS